MQFKAEKISDVWEEITPLVQKNYDETGIEAGEFSPSKSVYSLLDEKQRLHLIVARDNGKAVGFSSILISPHTHYKNQIFATQDAFYVLPEYRGIQAVRFFAFIEQDLKALGVNYILRDSCKRNDWSKTLIRSGYEEIKTLYIKKVGT